MASIEIESLLTPISADAPCGEDLEYDPEYTALVRLANPAPSERLVGPEVPPEDPPWPKVIERCVVLLGRTKDLRVAVILSRALFRTAGFPGFSQGVTLIRALTANFWEQVHPLVDDDGDGTARINTLRELCSRQGVLMYLRTVPFVAVPTLGSFSLKDFGHLTGESPQPAAADASKVEAALANCDLTQLQSTLAEVTHILTDLRGLESWVTEQLGVHQPLSFEELTTILERMQRLLQTRVTARMQKEVLTVQQPGAVAESSQGSDVIRVAAPTAVGGVIASRADVQLMLDQLCAWYDMHEPSSPVPLLLKRARRLAGMTFLEIVKDLAPDGAAQVEAIRGPESSG